MMNRDEIFLVNVCAHFDAVVFAVAEVPGLKRVRGSLVEVAGTSVI
jgi:hypothetical protein